LHRAPEAVAALLHLAADRGITRARIALRPAELGGVEVQLAHSAAGISARLIADSPEAARMLAQAGDDLRRSLAASDVTLLSLEVATSGDDRRDAQPGGGASGDAPGGHEPGRPAPSASGTEASAPDTVQGVIELAGGLLVDVLA
jgi:flagellar hook-length control protein FliK